MRLWRAELHTLAGAYALDAVSGADRARFERHLARCRACAPELRGLREATVGLAGAVVAQPPAALIEQTLAAAARTRQLPPVTSHAARWRPRPAARSGAARPAVHWQGLLPRLSPALAAVFLAAAAISGAATLTVEHHLGAAQARDQAIARVLTAPDAVILTARAHTGGTVAVVMSRRDHSLVFTTAGLPLLTGGRCYQLWLMGPGGDRSAGMLPPSHEGMTSPVIAAGLAANDHVGLTVEPDGGSSHPTTRPVLMLDLAA